MSNVSRYKAILKQVAADLDIAVDSEQCEHVGTLRLARRNILARLLRNDMLRTDPADLQKIDELLRQYQPASKAPQINVRYAEAVTGTYRCTHCGEQNHLESGTYTPAENKPPPQATVHCPHCGKDSRHEISSVPFDPPAADAKPAEVPNIRYREGVSASAFHAAVLRDDEIPPLKKEQPAIGTYVSPDTAAGLWRNDPNPTRNGAMAHQLPAVNGKG